MTVLQCDTHVASKVFISGALGFIGGVLADRYRSEGAEVRGVDVRADPALGVVAGDVASEGDWQRHAEGCDLVIHTAAYVGFGGDRTRSGARTFSGRAACWTPPRSRSASSSGTTRGCSRSRARGACRSPSRPGLPLPAAGR